MLRVVEGDHWYLYQCQQAIGYRLVAMGRGGRASIDQVKMPERWLRLMPLKRRSGIGRNVALPALDPPALLSKRWPAISEFLVATLFDDNTCRLPGEIKWSAKAAGWQVTLYDVEQALRLSVNAPDVEKAMSMLEQLLGVEDAPWEIDNYLQALKERREKKRKK